MKTILAVITAVLIFGTSVTTFAGPDDRQDRRQERGRSDERQDRRDCRREEGVAGQDKRECKQEEVRDGARGKQGERGPNGDDESDVPAADQDAGIAE